MSKAERKRTHCERLLELLSDGVWHNHHELYELRIVGHSRIAELRSVKFGYAIEHQQRGASGEQEHLYRLVAVPTPAPALEARLPEHVQHRLNSLFRSSPATSAEFFPDHEGSRHEASLKARPALPGAGVPGRDPDPAVHDLSPSEDGLHVPHRDPSKAEAEEAGPFTDGGRRDAQAGPAKQGPDQLDVDEIAALENELTALRSLDSLSAEELDRLDELAARHEQLDRSAA